MHKVFVAPDAECPKLVVGKLCANIAQSWVEWPNAPKRKMPCVLAASITLNGNFGINIWQVHPFSQDTPLDGVVDIAVLPDICTYPIIFQPADETATGIRIVRELAKANGAIMIGSKTALTDTSVYEYSSQMSNVSDTPPIHTTAAASAAASATEVVTSKRKRRRASRRDKADASSDASSHASSSGAEDNDGGDDDIDSVQLFTDSDAADDDDSAVSEDALGDDIVESDDVDVDDDDDDVDADDVASDAAESDMCDDGGDIL